MVSPKIVKMHQITVILILTKENGKKVDLNIISPMILEFRRRHLKRKIVVQFR